MEGTDEGAVTSGPDRPDWGQLGLVALALLILALAAVAIPALGGVSLGGPSQAGPDAGSESGFTDLETAPDGADADGASSGEAADGTNGAGDDTVAGDPEAGDGAVADGDLDDADTPGDADGADGSAIGDGTEGDALEVGDDPGGADAEDADASDGGSPDGADQPGDGDEFDDGELAGSSGEPGDGDEIGEGGGFGGGEPADGDGAGDGDVPGDGESGDGDELGTGAGDGGDPGDIDDGASGDDTEPGGGDADDDLVDLTDDVDGDATDGSDDGDLGDGADGGADENGDEPGGDAADGTDGENGPDDGDEGGETGAAYDISFEDSPSPGSEATATITEDGDPLEGATVFFDGEPVGTTDGDGRVTGTVPFTTELEVQIDPSGATQASVVRGGGGVPGGTGTPGGSGARQFSGGSVGAIQQWDNETRTTIQLDAETTLEVDGEFVAGSERTVTATVDGNPIPDGMVLVDGEEYGTTDIDGTATIEVPEDRENATVAVERDEIRAERTFDVRHFSVAVSDRLPVPGRTVDAAVTDGDGPVANATVSLEGEPVAETGADGTVAVQLPVASEATIAAQYDGATTETTVDGLYRNAAILGAAVVGVLALVAATLVRRYGASASAARSLPTRLYRRARELLHALGRFAVDAVVRLAGALERLGRWLAARIRGGWRALRRAGRWLYALPGELAAEGLDALAAIHPARLYAAIVGVVRSLIRSSRSGPESMVSSGSGGSASDDRAGRDGDQVGTLRELWQEFLALVRPPRLRTKTPGEIGRYAIEKGFPEPPVRTVVDTFRDTEYGRSSPSEDRLEEVQTAVRSVDGARTDSGDETATDGDDDTRTDSGDDTGTDGVDSSRPAGGEST
ncbi:DUF4129 domain-containing protein [Salinadaptatus halalkaliphilus]|uniref:DUF4129 domain-containing protein n=1 Tax=Salinadaptatus halalkaliphilus TaxID=2419781 RepID=A0A4V3VLJ0_9EURY|nr:DUF4129 domain-containing protein [Salinadaptatus halalkaliphilus]THE65747.1 DUF4129 domain-containing protein [Salinadaptatus halalkaliphilus]